MLPLPLPPNLRTPPANSRYQLISSTPSSPSLALSRACLSFCSSLENGLSLRDILVRPPLSLYLLVRELSNPAWSETPVMEARPPPRLTTSMSVSFSSISFPTILLLLSTWALSPALAQDVRLLPTAASSTFPACALSCATLQQAQSGCVPPAAPVSNQATYVSCFCQSALLTSLHTTPDSVCDSSCTSESDRQLLMTWYNNYCSSGGNPGSGTQTTTTAAAAATSTTVNAYPAPPSWSVFPRTCRRESLLTGALTTGSLPTGGGS